MSSALDKTCQSDPAAPTWLVKDMCELLSPFISLLFSNSLATGCFPQSLDRYTEKSGLDADELRNYKPCSSNLPLLSKLVQKLVQVRMQALTP